MNYKEMLKRLEEKCKELGFDVKYVSERRLADYAGMNYLAAKDMGYPNCGKKEFHIAKNMSAQEKYETLKHEIIERKLMADGDSYWEAHRQALRQED